MMTGPGGPLPPAPSRKGRGNAGRELPSPLPLREGLEERSKRPVTGAARLLLGLALSPAAITIALAQPAPDQVPLGLPPAAGLFTPLAQPAEPETQPAPNFRYQPGIPPGAPGPPAPGFTVTPSIGAGEMFNDNILQSQTDRRYDFITTIEPSVHVEGNTPRVNLNLTYRPALQLYARNSSQDAIAQQLFGLGTITLIPDELFVNTRALMAVEPTYGGFGGIGLDQPLAYTPTTAPGGLALGKQNRTQIYSVSVAPYLVHRFGTLGTGTAGVSVTETYQSSQAGLAPIPGAATTGSSQSLTGEATAQFKSGSDFGRIRDLALLDAVQSTGSGVLRDAHHDQAVNWIGYALTRWLTPFAEFGGESLAYSSTPTYRVDDAIWELGAIVTPGPDSQLSLGYGHHEGFDAAEAQGYWQATARTRLTLNYQTTLATDLQQIENQLGLADVDQLGNPVHATTGAPLFLGSGGLLSLQSSLNRNRALTATATTALDRDTLALTVQYQRQTPVASIAPASGITEEGESVTLAWRHEINERTNLGAGTSYSATSLGTAPPGNERFLAASVGLSYLLSETVVVSTRYTFLDRRSTIQGRTFNENIALLALAKKF